MNVVKGIDDREKSYENIEERQQKSCLGEGRQSLLVGDG